MSILDDYIEINKQSWNDKVDYHLNSDFYDVDSFRSGKSSLNSIELNLLGDIKGKKVLHLQCHFGMDSISLARMGAEVTAVDFSEKAIETGLQLANEENIKIQFICSDVLTLDHVLEDQFDIIFTSYGTIGWLHELEKWAKIVRHFLKPAGKFIFVEFHPVVWMFSDEFNSVAFSYFQSDPIIEKTQGTYADREADQEFTTISWNHSIGEVFASLTGQGLKIVDLKEYDYSPYNCFLGMEEFEAGKYRIAHFENRIPMVYSLVASY